MSQVAELCAAGGVPLKTATNRDLAASLAAAEKVAPDKATVSLIKSLATRAMSEAHYFSTGECLWCWALRQANDLNVQSFPRCFVGMAGWICFVRPVVRDCPR